MTVCVATLCEGSEALVFGTDREIGLSYVRGELGTQKARRLDKNWAMLIAGSDIGHAFDVQRSAMFKLSGEKAPITVDDAITAVTDAYKECRLQNAEALYLSSRGWTIDEFKKNGEERLPLSLYLQIDQQIERSDLEITLLVAGFDDFGKGHIFSVHDPGVAVRHDAFGFHAIGSGGLSATSILFFRKASPSMKLGKAIYCVYEAKTSGENAPGVGQETDIWVMTPHRGGAASVDYVGSESKKALRKTMDKIGPRELKGENLGALSKLSDVANYEKHLAKVKAEEEAKKKTDAAQEKAGGTAAT